MKEILLVIVIALCSSSLLAQKKKTSYQLYQMKGFIFFSENNKDYIDSLKNKHVIYQPFLRDIFIPSSKIDTSKTLIYNFLNSSNNNGIELPPFKERQYLKSMSTSFSNDSTLTECYKEKEFSLVAVIIKFKKYSNYPKIYNCHNTVVLLNQKRVIKFKYATPSIDVQKVIFVKCGNPK